jgi:hypothetical protein
MKVLNEQVSNVVFLWYNEWMFWLIIQTVQKESYSREMDALTSNRDLPRDSSIRSLDPYMDNDGLIRVGGRLRNSDLYNDL